MFAITQRQSKAAGDTNVKLTPWMLAVAAFLIIAAMAVWFLFKRLFAAEAQVIP